MGYKPVERKGYSLNEMAGNETAADSRGRVWGIRVYTLGELDRFHAALTPLMIRPSVKTWTRFLQAGLRETAPGLRERLRRAAGLPECSARRVSRAFTLKDAAAARERIVRANLDTSYGEFAARVAEIVKKKAMNAGAAAPAEKPAPETAEVSAAAGAERVAESQPTGAR